MPASWHVACNSLSGRRGRSILILVAVGFAAALVVAVSSAITSVQASMEDALVRVLGRTDARIIHASGGRFDDALLDEVRAWPEVRLASGRIYTLLPLERTNDERTAADDAAPRRLTVSAIGTDLDLDDAFLDLRLIAGRAPQSSREIMIDEIAAEELGAAVSDQLLVPGALRTVVTVVGVYQRPRLLAMLQTPQIRIDRALLVELMDERDAINQVLILLKAGTDVEAFCARYGEALPRLLQLEPAEMARSGFNRRIEASRFGVVITSMLSFLGASFIIVTALTTSVTEKQRELALLRTLGAFRRQLFLSQLLVGLIFGVLGAAIGIPLGLLLSWSIITYFHDMLPSGLALSTQGVALALTGSVVSGLLGAMYPAIAASRISPLEAMTRIARPVRWSMVGWCLVIVAACIALQSALMWLPNRDQRLYMYLFIGLPALHVAYFVLAIPTLLAVAALVGPLLARAIAVPADLLRRSVAATPFRHGFTAGALMLGLAILVATWAGGKSLLDDWLRQIEFPDGMVYHPTGITPEAQQAITELPFVRAWCPIGYLPVRIVGQQVFGVEGMTPPMSIAFGFDPDRFFTMANVRWVRGDPAVAIPRLRDGDAVIVEERFLIARNLSVGDTIRLASGRAEHEFEIVGVVAAAGLDMVAQHFGIRNAYMEYAIGGVFLDFDALADRFEHEDVVIIAMDLDAEVTDDAVAEAIAEVAPAVRFRSGRMIFDTIELIAVSGLQAQSAVAISALLLACFGMGNVIAASVHGRRYEFGVLRAIGAHRRALLRVILAEATLLAITGGITGTLFGLHQAWLVTIFYRDLAGIELRLLVPALPIALSWGVLLLFALGAALPAAIGLIRRSPAALVSLGRNE